MKKRLFRFLGPCLVLLVFALALRLLYGIVKDYSVHDIVDSVKQIPAVWIAAAVALTVVNYVILIGYDYLAVRYVGDTAAAVEDRPGFLRRLRVQLQHRRDLGRHVDSLPALLRLGRAADEDSPVAGDSRADVLVWRLRLGGGDFLGRPAARPQRRHGTSAGDNVAAITQKLPSAGHRTKDEWLHWVMKTLRWLSQYMRPIGGVLLALALAYVGLSALHKGSVRGVPLPPFSLTVQQILVASADLLVAAWVLHTLMPRMKGIDYPELVGIYMMAYVLVVLSHVPGGLGVLEPTILVLIPHEYRLQGFAALIVFRVIYYWAPMLIAMVLLGLYEFSLRKQWLSSSGTMPGAEPPNDA